MIFHVAIPHTRIVTFHGKRWLGLITVVLIMTFAGTSQAAPFAIGLAIENDMDSNGDITVITGSKVKVAYEVADPDKLLSKKDQIKLLRVSDDSVVSSVQRGKKQSGTVSLKVKNSEGEQLYVGYFLEGQPGPAATVSHPGDVDDTPLLSISKSNLADLTVRLNALENSDEKPVEPNNGYGEFYPAAGYDEFVNAKYACESVHGVGNCSNDGCGSCNNRGFHLTGAPNCNGSVYWNYDNDSQSMNCGWVDPQEILISTDGYNWTQ